MRTSLVTAGIILIATGSMLAADMTTYTAKYEQKLNDIILAHDIGMTSLTQQYTNSLYALLAKVKTAGDVDAAAKVVTEITRFARANGMPASPSSLPDIQKLQAAYSRQASALALDKAKSVLALASEFDQTLAPLQTNMVRSGKLDEASKIQQERRRVAESADTASAKTTIADYRNPQPASGSQTEAPRPTVQPSPRTPPQLKTKDVAPQPARKGTSPIGKWSSHPPDQPDIHLTMILFKDGRFEVQDDQEWSGTFKFLNAERTRVERTCRNGSVFILEYDPKTDEMTQNDGAPYRRITD